MWLVLLQRVLEGLELGKVLLVIRKCCHQVQSLGMSIGVLCVCLSLPDRPTAKCNCCLSGAYGIVHRLLWNSFICKYLGGGIFSKVMCCRMEGWSLEGFNFQTMQIVVWVLIVLRHLIVENDSRCP